MLVLAVGGAGAGVAAEGRVYETLIGAAIGVVVNFVVAPPVHVRPAGEAIGHLAARLEAFLLGLAGELRAGWSRAAADRWLTEARAFGPEVSQADRSLARAEQSAVLNPRGDEVRDAQPRRAAGCDWDALEDLLVPGAVLDDVHGRDGAGVIGDRLDREQSDVRRGPHVRRRPGRSVRHDEARGPRHGAACHPRRMRDPR